MKILQPPHFLNHTKGNECLALKWKHIDQAVEIWVNALGSLLPFDTILVMVRGGLVPATLLSHRLKIRKMKFFQGRRTASDTPFDYCSFSVTLFPDIDEKEKILIVEDIIYKGETVSQAVEFVKKSGGVIIGICTVVIDESFQNSMSNDLPLISAYKCAAEKWIRFPWEQSLHQESIPTVKKPSR